MKDQELRILGKVDELRYQHTKLSEHVRDSSVDDRSSANLSSMKTFSKLGGGKSATMLEVKAIT